MPADFRDTSPTRNLLGQVYGISAHPIAPGSSFLAQTRTATPGMPADFRDTSPTRKLARPGVRDKCSSHRSWLLFFSHRPGLQHPECPLPQDESSATQHEVARSPHVHPFSPRRLLAQPRKALRRKLYNTPSTTPQSSPPETILILLAQPRKALRRKLYNTPSTTPQSSPPETI